MKIVSKRHPDRKPARLPFEAINGGRLGFGRKNGTEIECARCGWTVEEYIKERDHRVFNKLAPFDWVTDEMLADIQP